MNIIPVTEHHRGQFNTCTGRTIDLKDPDPASIHIEDIARALSRICRFGGHSSAFYSVAQHSVLVAYFLPHNVRAQGLLHDASEAYLGDVIKPLKVLLEPNYRLIEEKFEQVIYKRFGIYNAVQSKKDFIKAVDISMLQMEHEALILKQPGKLIATMNEMGLRTDTAWAWSPREAETVFLEAFTSLFNTENA